MTNTDTTEAAYGPYFDVSARLDYLMADRDSSARLCAQKVLAGQFKAARWWAEMFAAEDAEVKRVLAWGNSSAPGRFVGMHHAH